VPLGARVRTMLQNRPGMYRITVVRENLGSGRRPGVNYSLYWGAASSENY
jgi:hypothetical protein